MRLLITSVFFSMLVSGLFAGERSSGVLELSYQPIQCITTPCPQFQVISMNGKPQGSLGADLVNLDPAKSSISSFRKIRVRGTWVQESENYLSVKVQSWEAIIRENIPQTDEEKK